MTGTAIIYALSGSDGRARYVGITRKSLEHRLDRHFKHVADGRQNPIHVWLKDVGREGVRIHRLEEVPDPLALAAEREWTRELFQTHPDLLNVHNTPNSHQINRGVPNTDEHNEKIRQARLGVPRPDVSKALKGRKRSPEVVARHAEMLRGRPLAPEARENVVKALRATTCKNYHQDRGIVNPGCSVCVERCTPDEIHTARQVLEWLAAESRWLSSPEGRTRTIACQICGKKCRGPRGLASHNRKGHGGSE